MAEYFFIVFFQILGVAYSVMGSVSSLDAAYPDKTPRQIFALFLKNDWDTLIISSIVLVSHVGIHFALEHYGLIEMFVDLPYYILVNFALAFVLGYAGQRIVYKVLNKAEKHIDRRVDEVK